MAHDAAMHHDHAHDSQSLTRSAFSATVHCLTGCAIGEVLGMILSTWWGWGAVASIALFGGARVLLRLRADQPAAAALRHAVPPGCAAGPGLGHRLDRHHGARRQTCS